MKNKNLLALLVFIAGPIALFASSDTDRKIEDAAKASYNYRTVLEDHVKVSANDGIVTHHTGTVQDKDDKESRGRHRGKSSGRAPAWTTRSRVEPTLIPSTPTPGWPLKSVARSWSKPTR